MRLQRRLAWGSRRGAIKITLDFKAPSKAMSTRATRFQRLERLEPNRFPRRKKPMQEATTEAAPAPTECAARRVELLEKELLEAKKEAGMATETAATETATPEVEVKEEANAVASVDESVPVEAAKAEAAAPVGESAEAAKVEVETEAKVEVEAAAPVGESATSAEAAKVEVEAEAKVGAEAAAPVGESATSVDAPAPVGESVSVDAQEVVEVPAPTAGPMNVTGAKDTEEAEDAEDVGGDAEKADEKTDEKTDETTDEKHDNKDEMSPEYRMMAVRLMRVEAAIEQLTMGSGVTALSVANAAVAAADKIAVAAAQQSVRVEAVAADLGASLAEKLEVSIQSAVEKGVSDHASLIGSRLHAQFEDRLQVARETALGLGAIRQEMSAVSKSLAKDIEGDLTPSKLPRHSILVDYK